MYDVNLDGYLSLKEIESGFNALFTMIGSDNSAAVLKKFAESSMKEMKTIEDNISTKQKESINEPNVSSKRKQSIKESKVAKHHNHEIISKGLF